MFSYLKGVKLPHKKNTVGFEAAEITDIPIVTIPTSMHIGKPAKTIVKKGDRVFVGTLIAEADGMVSSPVHSSVSGTVTGIAEVLLSSGNTCDGITVESDGKYELDPSIIPPVVNSKNDFEKALEKSGIVGLGGAGFPTDLKFKTEKNIEELIINGAECEPYITSDTFTMLTKTEFIISALQKLVEFYDIKKVIIGIEKNKPKAISVMKKAVCEIENAEVKVLPEIYPQGGEKVLVYHTTGKIIPVGKLPIDVGCVVCNCTTIAEIGKFLKTGIPLTEKTITVDGGAIENPQNVTVPIGTPIKNVFEFCGVKKEIAKVLYGGPMMGISVTDTEKTVLKNTNALLAFTDRECYIPKTTACIRCGSCVNHCPLGINPVAILKSYKENDFESMKKSGALLCMECGCCSYVCPAKIPNVQNNKLAKLALKKHSQKEINKI